MIRVFGRRRRGGRAQARGHDSALEQDREPGREPSGDHDTEASGAEGPGVGPAGQGPFDGAAAPADGHSRLDLGSLLLPVPEGAQLQVEVDRSGPVRAVHLMTGRGQLTVTAFAAPKSGGLWNDVADELIDQLRADGARVQEVDGEWGREIEAVTSQAVLRFLAVDGPRWLLRGVAAGSGQPVEALVEQLREVVRHTVVVRGSGPFPVRSPLPLRLPEPSGQADQAGGEA